jgi:hypothetical protein
LLLREATLDQIYKYIIIKLILYFTIFYGHAML